MKIAEDFRRIARESLTGNWLIAVLVGLVASLLGGLASEGPQVKINIDASNADVSFSFAGQNIFSTGGGLNSIGAVKEKGIDIEVKAIEKLIPFEKMDRL